MPVRILIVPDKFKGTLTASEAARAIARGWRRARPADQLDLFPISDGGDGFGRVLGRLLGSQPRRARVQDAAHRPTTAEWWWDPSTRTATFDSAGAIGMSKLPPGRFHPFDLDSAGLASLLRAAQRAGARRCIVGLGGSATNDAGFGLAQALGWTFQDVCGRVIRRWTDLPRLDSVLEPDEPVRFGELIAAVDCRNPLLGPRGATRIYGPQKGIHPSQLRKAEACHRRLARVGVHSRGHARVDGAGAAGGLGFAFVTFLGARIVPGFELIASAGALDRKIRSADIVITGEGRVDRSSFMGKCVGEIAVRARAAEVPLIIVAGASTLAGRTASEYPVHTLHDAETLSNLDHAGRLDALSTRVAREVSGWRSL